MKEYVLLFRMDITTESAQPTAAQMKGYMADWTSWIEAIAAEGKLAKGGHHFSRTGKVLTSKDGIIDGQYVADKASVAGYIIIRTEDMEDAIKIAERCPILNGPGASVEIRETASPYDL